MPQTLLGIPFADADTASLVDQALERGGLVVVPSGPGLAVDLRRNGAYRRALLEADLCLPDSGAMVVFARLFRGKRLRRISGLRFLEALLEHGEIKPAGATFWVHPDAGQQAVNTAWLEKAGIATEPADHYIAPHYPSSDLADPDLFAALRGRHPQVTILCIGGGVQERLGWWIREQYRDAGERCPAIICTGAAIGFLSGNQVNIPTWADRLFLGWFFRCLYQPRKFVPRYWSALPLAWLVARYGEALPPMQAEPARRKSTARPAGSAKKA